MIEQPDRAPIRDRNGELLATSLGTASLFADATQVLDPVAAAHRLKEVLPEINEADVRTKLTSERRFIWIHRNLTPRQQYAVNRLGIPGLSFQREARRVYPQGGREYAVSTVPKRLVVMAEIIDERRSH